MESRNIEDLVDPKSLSIARNEAEKQYGGLTSDEIDYLKKKCKTDLLFLGTILDYTKLTPGLHGDFSHWMEETRGCNYRLILLPRGHYKSTVATEIDSVQIALPNIANVQSYPHRLGPNVKLLLAHEVKDTAADFLYNIASAFTKKPGLLALFPECIPQKGPQRINKYELDLPDRQPDRDPTFSTIGTGGAAQGAHYNWIKLDDLIGAEARDSETVMRSALQWFDNIISLLTDPEDGFDLIGTRWAYSDVYSHAMEVYGIHLEDSITKCLNEKDIKRYGGGLLRTYARSVIEDGKPIFPEIMTRDRIRILRKNRLIWASQYVNNPQEAGMTEFPWAIKYYNTNPSEEIVVFTGNSEAFKRRLYQLDICIFCDPSMGEDKDSDESGIIVTGVDWLSNIFILETIKKRLLPPEFLDEIIRLNFKYQPRVVAIEEVNFSAIFRYWLKEKATDRRITLPIMPYKPGSARSKEARIRGLSHFFSAGQVYVHEGMLDFIEEYEQFPLGKSQHLLDALAQGPEFWVKGGERALGSSQDRMAMAVGYGQEDRDLDTGY